MAHIARCFVRPLAALAGDKHVFLANANTYYALWPQMIFHGFCLRWLLANTIKQFTGAESACFDGERTIGQPVKPSAVVQK